MNRLLGMLETSESMLNMLCAFWGLGMGEGLNIFKGVCDAPSKVQE